MALNQLYQQQIKQHANAPVGLSPTFQPTHQFDGYNPTCGDEITLLLKLEEIKLEALEFEELECASPQLKIPNNKPDALAVVANNQADHYHISQIGFTADACTICVASASLLCEFAANKSLKHLQAMTERLKTALNAPNESELNNLLTDTSLLCLGGVRQYPSRINCALLPWQTMIESITNEQTQAHKD
ncbi:iron-sulfur cluster assembly scaffold protein [Aliikangiella maris]|uniref:Iron-sulfur cluster assembly scaffold protein n=2 Tax=Aliikangiella maris TaxID=3162458 RepID=A0ABV3MPG2_9GAMM